MKLFSTNKIDEGALPVPEEAAAVKRPDLALPMVHGFLSHILQSVEADAERWQRQIACTPRGADFDLRDMGDGATVLDKLAMTGDALGEAIARNDPAIEVGQSVLPHLAAPFGALVERREVVKSDAKQNVFIKRYAPVLNRLEDDVHSIGRGMGDLSGIVARGAASLDPDATRRIFSRMRQLGDAAMLLVEERIASTGNREEGKRLRALRDDLKSWIEERNARLEQMQAAVDELSIRSYALRNECMMQAKRLAAAAALASRTGTGTASTSPLGGAEQASPEALVISATFRALMLESRTDVTAALRE
jgi:hypothetical protein